MPHAANADARVASVNGVYQKTMANVTFKMTKMTRRDQESDSEDMMMTCTQMLFI